MACERPLAKGLRARPKFTTRNPAPTFRASVWAENAGYCASPRAKEAPLTCQIIELA
jgi:hypothetical protein